MICYYNHSLIVISVTFTLKLVISNPDYNYDVLSPEVIKEEDCTEVNVLIEWCLLYYLLLVN